MKKLISHDIKIRKAAKYYEKKHFILKSIHKNLNFSNLTRWNAFLTLKNLIKCSNSKVSIVPRCLETINRKRFNKSTVFSRHVFLKLIRAGEIVGTKKASW
jgi:ribosomal protein S14